LEIRDIILPITLLTPIQIQKQIAGQAKQLRLEQNLSRKSLAEKSGIPASTIKRFETTGNIGIGALLAIALVLDCLTPFMQLFIQQAPLSLYDIPKQRERGRQ
jgi:transcriptional regulator with XRE-family HTH domain